MSDVVDRARRHVAFGLHESSHQLTVVAPTRVVTEWKVKRVRVHESVGLIESHAAQNYYQVGDQEEQAFLERQVFGDEYV